jgi:hypothetical protein
MRVAWWTHQATKRGRSGITIQIDVRENLSNTISCLKLANTNKVSASRSSNVVGAGGWSTNLKTSRTTVTEYARSSTSCVRDVECDTKYESGSRTSAAKILIAAGPNSTTTNHAHLFAVQNIMIVDNRSTAQHVSSAVPLIGRSPNNRTNEPTAAATTAKLAIQPHAIRNPLATC